MSVLNTYIKSLITFCLFLLVGMPTQGWASPDEDITIPFQMINGLIILQAEVDGVEAAYLLDTGADAVLIDGESSNANQTLMTTTGDVKMSSRTIANFKIGAFVQHEINAHIICLASLKKQLDLDIDGIIGGGYFMPHSLTMDFVHSTITISPVAPKKADLVGLSAVDFKVVNQVPVVEIEIEGKNNAFAMDSGATVHFMDQTFLSKLETANASESMSKVLTVNETTVSHKRYIVNKFEIGTTGFSGHHFLSQDFANIELDMDQPLAGILSLSQLVRTQMIFDFQNHILYFN